MLQESPMYAYLPAKDLARARRFYEEKLGFRLEREGAGGEGNILAIVQSLGPAAEGA
jgi:catechol 2,3-dioxygenase-like lactoylglutathione lyase family enzyme